MLAGEQVREHHDAPSNRGRRRAARVVLATVCLVLVATGCEVHLIRPSGDAPLRYRDEVFTDFTKTSDLVYGSAVNEAGQTIDLLLDVYEPTGDTATARPAVVWVHGGGFAVGSKTSPEIVDEATTFARKGFVNVSINYRLSPNGCSAGGVTVTCLAAITNARHDAQAAVRYLRANAATLGVDPDRIAIAGTSAGAITALNVGYGSDDPGSSGNPGYSSAVAASVSLSGARLLTAPNAGDAPALLFHGTADFTVPYQWAVNTVDSAKAAGLEAYLTTWEGAGHVPYLQHRTEILDQTTNFLYHKLQLAHAPQYVP
jgi:acetyl esterase/lipase